MITKTGGTFAVGFVKSVASGIPLFVLIFSIGCDKGGKLDTGSALSATAIAVSSMSVSEGSGQGTKTVSVTINRTGNSESDVSFDYAATDGSAVGSGVFADFVPVTGSLTIPAGQSSATFNITINEDIWDDSPAEDITVTLSGGSGYTASASSLTGTVTINDDDDFTLVNPLATYSFASDEPTTKAASVDSQGAVKGDYGYVVGNAGFRGRFRWDSVTGTVIFERSVASGSAWADINFIPGGNNAVMRYKLKELGHVSVEIKAQINVNNPGAGGGTSCAMLFAFGDGNAAATAANSGTNLRVGNRDWALSSNANKTPRDYFRIGWEAGDAAEKLTIDAPMNSYNGAAAWDRFTPAQWLEAAGEFDVMRNTSLTTAGDYVTYRQDMYFDFPGNQVIVTITPLSSNVDMTGWQAQTVVWDPSAAVGATAPSGSARGGLDLTNITGPTAMTMTAFAEEYVNLGFTGNLAPRACEFSNLKVHKPQ